MAKEGKSSRLEGRPAKECVKLKSRISDGKHHPTSEAVPHEPAAFRMQLAALKATRHTKREQRQLESSQPEYREAV